MSNGESIHSHHFMRGSLYTGPPYFWFRLRQALQTLQMDIASVARYDVGYAGPQKALLYPTVIINYRVVPYDVKARQRAVT